MALGDGAQGIADIAFAKGAGDRLGGQRNAGRKGWKQDVEHGLEDVRHARHHMYVLNRKARRLRHRIRNQLRADRRARHAPPGGREFEVAAGIIALQEFDGLRMFRHLKPESRTDGVGCDVVMGRTDAAGCDDEIIAGAQGVDRLDDRILLIGDDPHLLQIDARQSHHLGEMADILVLCAPGQKFVPDGEHGGCRLGLRGLAHRSGSFESPTGQGAALRELSGGAARRQSGSDTPSAPQGVHIGPRGST